MTACMKAAYDECKERVAQIAAHCRAKNRKFRDVEFDLENDRQKCLHNLVENNLFSPSDVRRVSDLFESPVFYSGTTKSAEIVQGEVQDCYLVSALSSMTSVAGLVEGFCVARDEVVGVYGFIFYRDCYWVPVIVDDLLFTRVPKYEQLAAVEKELYHFDKEKYNSTARKGGESLYFSKCGKSGETWVPLVEKAYAKLHGDYASVGFGRPCDAIEDMTGGVSNLILTTDILDVDKFWNDELLKANTDRLFGCWFKTLDGGRSGLTNATVDGLVGNLSHSVIRAIEVKGKRFVVLRNPWGEASWGGPWSDGSKEWTPEWLEVLPQLGHDFGGNGQFVMDYSDFLNIWQEIQRTLLFDDSWVMSAQYLHIPEQPKYQAWSFGDISFTFSVPVASPTLIVLSKINTRYFKDIEGPCIWTVDFILAKEGATRPLAESSYAFFYTRSTSLEIDLEAGNYVVHARLDPSLVRSKDYFRNGIDFGWDKRKLARIMTERAKGQSIASNYKPNPKHLVTPITTILSGEAAKADTSSLEALKTYGDVKPGESITVTTTTTTKTVVAKSSQEASSSANTVNRTDPMNGVNGHRHNGVHQPANSPRNGMHSPPPNPYSGAYPVSSRHPIEPRWAGGLPASVADSPPQSPQPAYPGCLASFPAPMIIPAPIAYSPPPPPPSQEVLEDDNTIVIGLRVYTHKSAPTLICGRLKSGLEKGS